MALYENVRGKIFRQEVETVYIGPHHTYYSAAVKYSPEHIKSSEFFDLCYNLVKAGDIVDVRLIRNNKTERLYHFIILDADVEHKTVSARLLSEIDLVNDPLPITAEGTTLTVKDITNLIETTLGVAILPKITELKEAFEKYTAETDDQLEEIENNIKAITEE